MYSGRNLVHVRRAILAFISNDHVQMDPQLLRTKFTLDIVEKLELPAIVPHLVEAELLTRHDQEELMNKHHSQDIRIMQWIDKLVKKGSAGVSRFINCLIRCREAGGHEELLQKMMGVAARLDNPVQPAMQQATTSTCTLEVHPNEMISPSLSCSAELRVATSSNNYVSESSLITGNPQPVFPHIGLLNPTELRTKYLTQLIQHLDIIAITPHLVTVGLLQRHEQEHLLNELISSKERIMKLVENLGRGGQESVLKFFDCLRKTKNVPGHYILLQVMQNGVQYKGNPITESVNIPVLSPSCYQPYTELITYIDGMAQMVSSNKLLEIAALFLPDDHLNTLCRYGSLTFQSLACYLSQIGICNPIEVDSLMVILTELNQYSLTESVLDYACSIRNASIHHFQLSSDGIPSSGFFLLYISHQISPQTACEVWDLKQNMSLTLMDDSSYRGQFWFRGISLDSETVVWQFLSAHEQQICRKLIKLQETVNIIQYQNSSGFVSTQFTSRSLLELTHNENQSLGMTFRLVLSKVHCIRNHKYAHVHLRETKQS